MKALQKMKNAESLSEIEGVYWSARDMKNSFVGNHHFITFIYNSEEQAKEVTKQYKSEQNDEILYKHEQNDEKIKVFFTTMGASKENKAIKIKYNPKSDIQAIHEIAKKDNTKWHESDYDYEGHCVPYNLSCNNYASSEELMNAILQRVYNFNERYNAGITVDYSLIDRNCATLVNSIFKVLECSKEDRKELGEFTGVDWGEEKLIPNSFFDDIIFMPGAVGREVEERYDWSSGWSTVEFYEAGGKTYLFLLKEKGDVHIHQMNSDGTVGARVDTRDWSTGWTQAQPFSVDNQLFLFLLKESDRCVHIHKIESNGTVGDSVDTRAWSSGWSTVEFYEAGGKTYLFLLKEKGDVHIHQMNSDGTVGARVDTRDWSTGWTQAQPFSVDNQLFLFLLKENGGDVHIHQIFIV